MLTSLLLSCTTPESGIDHTIVSGTLLIPPSTASDSRTNDDVSSATPLGVDGRSLLTWRSVILDGKVAEWPAGSDAPGDPDNYSFTPVADGTFTFTLTFDTTSLITDTGDTAAPAGPGPGDTGDTGDTGITDTGDTGDTGITDTGDTGDTGVIVTPVYSDADVLRVQIIDPASYDGAGAGVIAEHTSDGFVGNLSFEQEVVKGKTYVVQVFGVASESEAVLDYRMVVSGSAPDDSTILVGAFLGSDATVAENPAGGTNAVDWVYDPVTSIWYGAWTMTWIRTVTTGVDSDTGDLFPASSEVSEGASAVYLRAGSYSSLNARLAAGALYSTAVVEVTPSGTTQEVTDPLVLDGVAPKIIGVVSGETLPDSTLAEVAMSDGTLDLTTLVAQDIGALSVPGFVDVITGSSTLSPYEGWNSTNDSDAYAFTLTEAANVTMTVAWAGTADLDIGIWYEDPEYGVIDLFPAESYCLTGDNPEVCSSDLPLSAGVTYYVVVLGYSGAGEVPYTVELEWAP